MQKRYKPQELAEAVDKYFNSIRVVRPLILAEIDYQEQPDGSFSVELDAFGHPKKKFVRPVAADGTPATEELWIKKPSMAGLCLFLGIHRSTWAEYGKKKAYADTVERARGRVEDYLAGKVLEKSSAAGAKFSLQHNCGWKERQEISLDRQTREAIKPQSAQRKLELLAELKKMDIPGEEQSDESRQADQAGADAQADGV